MNFGDALRALRRGDNVERLGWNGKGMWLRLVRDWGGVGVTGKVLPFVVMKTADGSMVPWLASQTDILAEDWCLCSEGDVKNPGGVLKQAERAGDAAQGQTVTPLPSRPNLSPGTIIDKPSYVVDLGGNGWMIDPAGHSISVHAPPTSAGR